MTFIKIEIKLKIIGEYTHAHTQQPPGNWLNMTQQIERRNKEKTISKVDDAIHFKVDDAIEVIALPF